MLGSSGYKRNPLDFYPTPRRAIDSMLTVIGEDLPAYLGWEPFCGNGAVSTVIKDETRDFVSTDIKAYDGFDADGLFDFFAIKSTEVTKVQISKYDDAGNVTGQETRWMSAIPGDTSITMADIANLKGFMPDLIVTNPPYNEGRIDLAGNAARHALALMEPQIGTVVFFCRNEWDCSKKRADLFDHPAFAAKIILRHRPRWIEGSKGAPRHNYAWYVWSWNKALTAPHSKAAIFYVR